VHQIEFTTVHSYGSVAQSTSRTARLDQIAKALMSGELAAAELAEIQELALRQHRVILD
jgi:hypothetical protein